MVLSLRACAKVNLSLEVVGRLPDGYHRVVTVLQSISLCDRVYLEPADDLRLHCRPCSLAGPDNLALRAALLLREHTGAPRGARIRLWKRIPVAAGLGGGSSDAAAVLLGLDRLWGLGLGPSGLHPLASRLGVDVPFFLCGGTALATGRGDHLTPLPSPPRTWLVLLFPPLHREEKTASLYRMLTPAHYSDGSTTLALAEALRQGRFSPHLPAVNTFERVAGEAFPGLGDYIRAFREAGAEPVRLTGTGPALFTLVGRRGEALALLRRLRARGLACAMAHTLDAGEAFTAGP